MKSLAEGKSRRRTKREERRRRGENQRGIAESSYPWRAVMLPSHKDPSVPNSRTAGFLISTVTGSETRLPGTQLQIQQPLGQFTK